MDYRKFYANKFAGAAVAIVVGVIMLYAIDLSGDFIRRAADVYDSGTTADSTLAPLALVVACWSGAMAGRVLGRSGFWTAFIVPVLLLCFVLTPQINRGLLATPLNSFCAVVHAAFGASRGYPFLLLTCAALSAAWLGTISASRPGTSMALTAVGVVLSTVLLTASFLTLSYSQMRAEVELSYFWSQRVHDATLKRILPSELKRAQSKRSAAGTQLQMKNKD